MKLEFTPEVIETLKENEVFVFGSNLNGNHAGGAALTAVEKFGAVMGQAEGIQGKSYAIPTLNESMDKVTEEDLTVYLDNFRLYAKTNGDKIFYLTKIGCGIAGFDINYMSYMIVKAMLPYNVIVPKEFTEIAGYKGFNPNMTCRGFKYEIEEGYEDKGKIEACSRGFHFCTNPFDVFGYYPPSNKNGINKFCSVKGGGNMDVDNGDTKVACSKLYISAEIGLNGVINEGVKFILNNVNWKNNKNTNTGHRSAATNKGHRSAATNTGNYSAATNTGYQSAATNTGDYSAAVVEGKESIAIVTGRDSKAKGAIGCWIVLTERGVWDGITYPIKEVRAFKVDGNDIKSDTWYKLVDGKAIEVEE